MSSPPDAEPVLDLVADIGAFMEDREAVARFDDLAARAFALQLERIEPYRRLCAARGVGPADVVGPEGWRRVPAVPVSAFRSLPLHVAPPVETFRSSGTTAGPERRSVHRHPFPDLYRTVIDATFARACLPACLGDGHGAARRPIVSLVPSRAQMPDSSLGFHCARVLERHGDARSVVAFGEGGVDPDAAVRFLRDREDDKAPATVLATAFALVQLFDALDARGRRCALPDRSTVMETGGFKGKTRAVARADLVARIKDRLGVPAHCVVREYGMTELTGHFYTDVLAGGDPDVFAVPPWMRVRMLDPGTLDEVPIGETGLVAIFDLANVGSAVHVLTQDLGRVEPDTSPDTTRFRLLGRAEGSDLRGCSLVVEELAGA